MAQQERAIRQDNLAVTHGVYKLMPPLMQAVRCHRFAGLDEASAADSDAARFTASLAPEIHDRMTECPYPKPLVDFDSGATPAAVGTVPVRYSP